MMILTVRYVGLPQLPRASSRWGLAGAVRGVHIMARHTQSCAERPPCGGQRRGLPGRVARAAGKHVSWWGDRTRKRRAGPQDSRRLLSWKTFGGEVVLV